MKNLFTKFLALSGAALLMLASCKKDETKVVASSGTGGTLTASTTTPVLTKATAANTALTFSFTNPDFGYSAATTNTLQIAVKGTNFANTAQLKEVTLAAGVKSQAYNVLDFNNMLLSMNLPTGVASQLDVRVKSVIGTTVQPVYSNVLTVNVTPFAIISWVYVPGAYQGWNPPTADSLISATGNGVYVGSIYFTPGSLGHKITPAKKWDVAYGTAGGNKISTSGGDLNAPGAGSYQITVDLNNNTIEYAYNQWSVIGDATPGGWGTDTDMKYNNATGKWEVTVALLSSGKYKFRYKHDWGVNLGGTPAALTQGGADIAVAASGNYKIVLDATANTFTATKL